MPLTHLHTNAIPVGNPPRHSLVTQHLHGLNLHITHIHRVPSGSHKRSLQGLASPCIPALAYHHCLQSPFPSLECVGGPVYILHCIGYVLPSVVELHWTQLFSWENLTQTYYRQWDVFIIPNRAHLTLSKGDGDLMLSTLVCLGVSSKSPGSKMKACLAY